MQWFKEYVVAKDMLHNVNIVRSRPGLVTAICSGCVWLCTAPIWEILTLSSGPDEPQFTDTDLCGIFMHYIHYRYRNFKPKCGLFQLGERVVAYVRTAFL